MSKKILIVGGVAGGASAAARARRLDENAEIIMFERGPDISFANCGLPYHIGGEIAEREKLLVTTPQAMKAKFNIDVRVLQEVTAIDPKKKSITIKDLEKDCEYEEHYDNLILSPGAAPIRPKIPGIESERVLTLRNLQDMDQIIDRLGENTKTAVIGGGYIGLEMAEALKHRKLPTTLIELAPQVMGPADPEMVSVLHQELRLYGVDLKLKKSVVAFEESEQGIELTLSDGERIDVDIAILAIGVRPENSLALDAGLQLGKTGGIKVNTNMQTSDPAIYAVGDAVEVTDFTTGTQSLIPLAGPANRQGRIAADNIFGRKSVYKNTQGTAICKVFNMAIGMTGLSEKAAVRANIPYEKVYVHPASHASYYPEAHPISLKIVFDPKNGKLLGAQAVGADGVDKRIDVLATAIRHNLTVYDLEEMELCYAPPFGSAKDPINYAGFVAANVIKGDAHICHTNDVLNLNDNQVLVDVRTQEEILTGTIPGAKTIPLEELRNRISEFSKDKEYLVFCKVGLNGYLACRILKHHGIKCWNLTGGYKTYMMVMDQVSAEVPESEMVQDDPGNESLLPPETKPGNIVREIDACGLQCPGPIMQLGQAMKELKPGEAIAITSTDPGFASDAPAWCQSTGNQLDALEATKGVYKAIITKKPDTISTAALCKPTKKRFTNVVFSDDFDKTMAAFIIANGAASMGYEVTLFFTFWGLNILRKEGPVSVKKNPIEKMFGIMMPKGPKKLKLSQMNMGGMGLGMIKGIMKHKNVATLPELIESAQSNGVKLVVCTMSMDLMGIKREELISGVEEGGVAMYIEHAGDNANLFI